MNCTIIWNKLSLSEWEEVFRLVSRSNLLQSYAYGQAICALNRQTARWGVIEIAGKRAGIVQILEAGAFKKLFHAVIIDRAPLWFKGYGNAEHFKAFAIALNSEFPRRIGRKRRFIPETQDSNALIKSGFKPINKNTYQTIWLDLRLSDESLLKNLNAKWRNKLRKSQKANLKIEWDDIGQHLPWLLNIYNADKKARGYNGASVKLLIALAKTFIPKKNMLIARALIDNKPVAAILVLNHGSSATYQIGWSSPDGRKTAAHNLLLWDALKILKNKGIKDFDLGGINDESAKGVKKFKENMGGEIVYLAGLYS
ncbi:MAG: GNAT family N-acetyltransferase [Alphaproteobacteria bacterium]|nr:GNAT family N-acetyltransferase [Alphaproteobacteria bacterium]